MPSLSGRIFEHGSDFEKKLTDYETPSFGFRIVPSSDRSVLATVLTTSYEEPPEDSAHSPNAVTIEIIDVGGICRISSATNEFEDLRSAWSAFRRALDGCSDTGFDCSSMILPIKIENSENPYDVLARKMLDSVEANVDMIAYSAGKSFKWTKKENPISFARADCDANALYFSFFMELYKNKLESRCWSARIAEMERRMDKLEMACRLVEDREMHWFNRTSVTLSRSAVVIAIIAVLISISC